MLERERIREDTILDKSCTDFSSYRLLGDRPPMSFAELLAHVQPKLSKEGSHQLLAVLSDKVLDAWPEKECKNRALLKKMHARFCLQPSDILKALGPDAFHSRTFLGHLFEIMVLLLEDADTKEDVGSEKSHGCDGDSGGKAYSGGEEDYGITEVSRTRKAFLEATKMINTQSAFRQNAPKGKGERGVAKSSKVVAHDARKAREILEQLRTERDQALDIGGTPSTSSRLDSDAQSTLDSHVRRYEHHRSGTDGRNGKRKRSAKGSATCDSEIDSGSASSRALDFHDGLTRNCLRGTTLDDIAAFHIPTPPNEGSLKMASFTWDDSSILASTDIPGKPHTSSVVSSAGQDVAVRKQPHPAIRGNQEKTEAITDSTASTPVALIAIRNHSNQCPDSSDLTDDSDRRPARPSDDPLQQRALKSLEHGQWLTTTAVQKAAELFNPDREIWRIAEPIVLAKGLPKTIASVHANNSSDENIVVFVNLESKHWTVGIVYMKEHEVRIYDPMHVEDSIRKTRKVVVDFASKLSRRRWNVLEGSAHLRQNNSYDCGVFALAFAAYNMCSKQLPSSICAEVWRKVVRDCLTVDSQEYAPFATIGDKFRPESTADAQSHGLPETLHELVAFAENRKAIEQRVGELRKILLLCEIKHSAYTTKSKRMEVTLRMLKAERQPCGPFILRGFREAEDMISYLGQELKACDIALKASERQAASLKTRAKRAIDECW